MGSGEYAIEFDVEAEMQWALDVMCAAHSAGYEAEPTLDE